MSQKSAVDTLFEDLGRLPWWFGPAVAVLIGAITFLVARVFGPGPGETVLLLGYPWGEQCAFLTTTGFPCPQCGMTRAWIHGARGDIGLSFLYSPAGALLFFALVLYGLVGLLRLLTKNPHLLRLSYRSRLIIALVWISGPWIGGWIARCWLGWNPLP